MLIYSILFDYVLTSQQNIVKRGKKIDHTEEWREGSVEERLEYALVKVTGHLLSAFFAAVSLLSTEISQQL